MIRMSKKVQELYDELQDRLYGNITEVFTYFHKRNPVKPKFKLDTKIIEDLGANSLEAEYLRMSVEDEFNIEIKDKDLGNIKTVRDILVYVIEHSELDGVVKKNKEGLLKLVS